MIAIFSAVEGSCRHHSVWKASKKKYVYIRQLPLKYQSFSFL